MNFSGKIRFAPSPTGYLHEGHLLSALYVWASARKWNLHIHLRIEDHDRGRTRDEYVNGIREDLSWMGFIPHSESIQSERASIYQQVMERLAKANLVYPCTCSRKQLLMENPRSDTGEIVYQGKCRLLAESSKANGDMMMQPHNMRFKVQNKVIDWTDYRLGEFHENPAQQCGDFPLMDRDGCYTYQLCVATDDLEQQITHIVRGEDIISSTARQIALSETLCKVAAGIGNIPSEYRRPLYLHHPLIVDSAGKKLSKRELAHSIREDKNAGISPEELLGRVLFKAGFSPNKAPISLNDAIQRVVNSL